ncbi:hypothetical protein RchiOBHm_Chr4g0420351 [Rosa chinensis]|uniref:Uncharacterized protein n=1 Tax=Rosa chinensis TaxID=74649 RepID=A0A2P6QXW9_ROSCH|nr:hypothetical protein RchiOBHm_Chr4g0420351 [Rosa chinensis]
MRMKHTLLLSPKFFYNTLSARCCSHFFFSLNPMMIRKPDDATQLPMTEANDL